MFGWFVVLEGGGFLLHCSFWFLFMKERGIWLLSGACFCRGWRFAAMWSLSLL
ncbi:hypothetical protein LBE40_00190 [Bartonella taylorii]|uniref:hypothetical protein n=1 Tax=Bartonella taylorii TaxID=33046 RepID=UPI00208F961A|nr:hypothetical protein [Bartonella taylorii]USP01306.1 hypothetical protein LBE40_00190 [Bartonella taylorii]